MQKSVTSDATDDLCISGTLGFFFFWGGGYVDVLLNYIMIIRDFILATSRLSQDKHEPCQPLC